MDDTLLTNCSVRGIDEPVQIAISGGRVAAVSGQAKVEAETIYDLNGATLLPGFIDVHNHGAVGVDVNTATAESLLEVGTFLARNGVTAWMPTLVPDSDEVYLRVVDAINDAMRRQQEIPIAQIVGVHYEGVFASEAMCGALRPQFFKTFDGEIGLPMLESGVHMTTLAPEINGGIELVAELTRHGWISSIGHTKADPETLDAAFEAGARHMTHFFNAMTGIHHRDLGVAGWGLCCPEVTFDIIADGVHVHPTMLELACRSKGTDSVSLISDSVAPTGLEDGEFELWGEKISVLNGKTQNERGSIAGSVCTMQDGVRMMRSIGFSDVDIENISSRNPARLLGLYSDRGSIEAGKRADLVAIDSLGEIKMTMIGGEIVE